MFDIGTAEFLIVFVIVVLLFGPGHLARTMSEVEKGCIPSMSRYLLKKTLILLLKPTSLQNRTIFDNAV
jgi:hypothetical protein